MRDITIQLISNKIDLKEKGRGFSLSSELFALSFVPLPGPFPNRKGFAYAKITLFRD